MSIDIGTIRRPVDSRTFHLPTVIGAIRDKWMALGGYHSFLGLPLTDELITPDGIGRFNHFYGGSIYWTPGTGAHEVHGAIRDRWAALGWERFLGYPLTDELPTPDGKGRFSQFQNASIHWTSQTGAHETHGAIRAKWAAMGWERSFLGYPLTDESPTPDGIGRFNHFQGGSIYWTPQTGAYEVHGAIRDKWAAMGWERSFLGYPTSDELASPDGGRISHFEHGSIVWTQAGGAVPLGQVVHHHADIATPDWLPAGGWVDVIVNDQGHYTFAGHMHNSGFPNIDFALAVVLMTPSGIGYGFARQHRLDGTVTLFGRNRDDDWTDTGVRPELARGWDQIAQSRLHWRLVASDTLSRGIQGLVEDLVQDAAKQLGKAAVTALIALI